MKEQTKLSVADIHKRLIKMWGYGGIYIPEFTWENLRVDGIMIDVRHRWIRGFEIKIRKQDFDKDNKWTEYSRFCSSLSIVCPAELIQPEEIEAPFGLLWIGNDDYNWANWKKKPKNFQKRNSLAWLYTYTTVLELEIRRLNFECLDYRTEQYSDKQANKERGER